MKCPEDASMIPMEDDKRGDLMGLTYSVVMKTQIGARKGKLYLEQSQKKIMGFLSILGQENPVRGTATDNRQFILKGELVTLVRTIPFLARGYADEKMVELTLYCPNNTFCITGTATGGE